MKPPLLMRYQNQGYFFKESKKLHYCKCNSELHFFVGCSFRLAAGKFTVLHLIYRRVCDKQTVPSIKMPFYAVRKGRTPGIYESW